MEILGKISGYLLLTFVPGYFFCRFILKIKNSYYYLFTFSAVFSFILSPLITLPLALIIGQANKFVIIVSIIIFCLICFILGKKTSFQLQISNDFFPLFWSFLVVAGVFIAYIPTGLQLIRYAYESTNDFVKFGSDTIYLRSITIALSKKIPPYNPVASFAKLTQTWGPWYFYAMIHNLVGISIEKAFFFSGFYLCFILLNLVNIVGSQLFRNRSAGGWLIFLIFDRSNFLLTSLWRKIMTIWPEFIPARTASAPSIFRSVMTARGFYISQVLLIIFLSLFFLLKFQQDKQKIYFYLTLFVLSAFPFFHAGHYLIFWGGIGILLFWKIIAKEFDFYNLLYLATPLPFYLLYVRCYAAKGLSTPLPFWPAFHPERIFWFAKLGIILPILAFLAYKYQHPDKKLRQTALYLSIFAAFPMIFSLVSDNIQLSGAWYYMTSFISSAFLGLYALITIKENYSAKLFRTLGVIILISVIPPFVKYFNRAIIPLKKPLKKFNHNITEASDWIRSYSDPNEIFLVMHNSPSVNYITGRTDRRLVYGHDMHILSSGTAAELARIRNEVETIFCPSNRETFYRLCLKYKVNYIYVGKCEDRIMEDCSDRYKWEKDSNLMFHNNEVKIYRIDSVQVR
jgi:hypothetical protein